MIGCIWRKASFCVLWWIMLPTYVFIKKQQILINEIPDITEQKSVLPCWLLLAFFLIFYLNSSQLVVRLTKSRIIEFLRIVFFFVNFTLCVSMKNICHLTNVKQSLPIWKMGKQSTCSDLCRTSGFPVTGTVLFHILLLLGQRQV